MLINASTRGRHAESRGKRDLSGQITHRQNCSLWWDWVLACLSCRINYNYYVTVSRRPGDFLVFVCAYLTLEREHETANQRSLSMCVCNGVFIHTFIAWKFKKERLSYFIPAKWVAFSFISSKHTIPTFTKLLQMCYLCANYPVVRPFPPAKSALSF